MRSGVVARKIGMTRVYLDTGESVPVTVVHLDGCHVVSLRTEERDGYAAVQVGSGRVKPVRLTKAQRGHFARNEVSPRARLVEFRVEDPSSVPVGAEIKADHFVSGQYVDVTGVSLGKGFAGGMKRWNFRGLRASHGVSISHRSIGSTGGRQDPGRTFKNKKMPGHLGSERVTVMNLEVVRTDAARGLIWIKGALPGFKSGWVRIRDAVKKTLPEAAPIPGSFHFPNEQKVEA